MRSPWGFAERQGPCNGVIPGLAPPKRISTTSVRQESHRDLYVTLWFLSWLSEDFRGEKKRNEGWSENKVRLLVTRVHLPLFKCQTLSSAEQRHHSV